MIRLPGQRVDGDRPVRVGIAKGASRAAKRPGCRTAGLAALLLASVSMGSCLVPQAIQEYQAPPAPTHSPPVLQLQTAYPSAAVVCFDHTNLSSASFYITVSDGDALTNQQPLTVRWFLDYVAANAPASEVPLLPDTTLTPVIEQGTAYYKVVQFAGQLQFPAASIHALEVVVSDGFDSGDVLPFNRAAAQGYNVTSYKWVIDYAGEGECPAS